LRLFWTQFFSAFSDNFLKNSLVFSSCFISAARRGRPDHACRCGLHRALFFLSALGGQLADRYDKAVVAQR
jgi:acyl-[acyl-carrier-protein]-phospholipid O-acyltransferase/long-chain-fatty-acid--[acyl-carrier-protein] ligase